MVRNKCFGIGLETKKHASMNLLTMGNQFEANIISGVGVSVKECGLKVFEREMPPWGSGERTKSNGAIM